MATELELHTLLASIERSLREPFSAWLVRDELTLRREKQVMLYLERINRPDFRTHMISRLSPPAHTLLHYILLEKNPIAGPIIADVAAKGYTVTTAHLGELHSRGFVFFEDAELWPGNTAVWTRKHMEGQLIVPPPFKDDTLSLCSPDAPDVFHSKNVKVIDSPDDSLISCALRAFLSCVSKGTLKLTQRGQFTSRSLNAFEKETESELCTDLFSPEYLLQFARNRTLVKIDSTGTIIPSRRFASFRRKSLPEQTSEFLTYSFSHPAALDEQEANTEEYGFDVAHFCKLYLRYIISHHATTTWMSIPSLSTSARDALNNTFYPEKGRRRWFWPHSEMPLPSQRTMREYTEKCIDSWFLKTAIVEKGKDARGVECIRLTPLGLFWLQGDVEPLHEDDTPQKLVMQPDFTALLTHSGPWDPVAQVLSLFAERQGDHNASIFTFTRESVREAIQHGHSIDELFSTLDEHSTYPIPDNVRHTLYDWCHISSHITLYRDVHLFSFSSKKERDEFVAKEKIRLRAAPVGKEFAMVSGTENDVLNVMQVIHALPVDYGEPPNDGLDIKQDGRVECNAPHDLRVIALRNAIAEPVGKGDKKKYFLSRASMKKIDDQEEVYSRIINLPGRPLPLNTRLNVLVGLQLLPQKESNTYVILDRISAADRNRLKKEVTWREACLVRMSRDAYVIADEWRERITAGLKKLRIKAMVHSVTMRPIPMR